MTPAPLCPTCRYDLSATPDGRCPECGSDFTHSWLAWRSRRSQINRDVLVDTCNCVAVGLLLFCGLPTSMLAARGPEDALVAGAILAYFWTLALLSMLPRYRHRSGRWLAPAAAAVNTVTVAAVLWSTPMGPPLVVFGLVSLGAIGSTFGWWRNGARTGLTSGSLLLLVVGAAQYGHAISRAAAGFRWTDLSWRIEEYNPNGYPMSINDAQMTAAAFVLAGVIGLLGSAIWMFAATLTPSPSPAPSSSPCPPGSAPPSPRPPAPP